MTRPDICIVWLNVHGGVFHKLLHLHSALTQAGLACELFFSAGPPLGLKIGVDIPRQLLPEFADAGIFFLPRAEALARAEASKASLLLTDAHYDADLPNLIAAAHRRGVITAQMATLLGDFTFHGAQHVLMQHPLTLFYEREYNHTQESRRLFLAHGIHFTGNIFFEPTLNTLFGGFQNREAFCAKYDFDPARPIFLWLPNHCDVEDPVYGDVIRMAAEAGVNLAVKLHPWEYAFTKHGTDTWHLGRTSADIWGIRAVDEPDGSWAYHFCDAAIIRGSSTCLETPFWNRPNIILPPAIAIALFVSQAHLVARNSVILNKTDELREALLSPPRFSPEDYAAARASVRLDTTRDAYVQTVETLVGILDGTIPGNPTDNASVGRLYDRFITRDLASCLAFGHRMHFEADRLWRRLTAILHR